MEDQIEVFKALSDRNRLLIIEMLSCGEMCGNDIMNGLNLTQPTISHHMKILHKSGLVGSRKNGKWTIYSLEEKAFDEISEFIKKISSYKDDCICHGVKGNCCPEVTLLEKNKK